MDVEIVSLFKRRREYTCLHLQGIPDSKIIITSVLQGKGLLKTYWLEGKVDVEIVSPFKPRREYTCLHLQGIPDSKIIITSVLQGKGLLKTYSINLGENTRVCTFREFPILK